VSAITASMRRTAIKKKANVADIIASPVSCSMTPRTVSVCVYLGGGKSAAIPLGPSGPLGRLVGESTSILLLWAVAVAAVRDRTARQCAPFALSGM
jgi:hypothetical protein